MQNSENHLETKSNNYDNTISPESNTSLDVQKKINKSENRIPLNETVAHRKSSVIKYTVQNGETLQNISKKFSISKELIKSSNGLLDHNVHPGEILKIYLDAQLLDFMNPISVLRYDPNGKKNHIKGKLMIKDYELVFHPHSIKYHQIKIKLFGHLEASMVKDPNPIFFAKPKHHHHHLMSSDSGFDTSDELSIQDISDQGVLSIEYSNDNNIITTDYFTGNAEDLKEYQRELENISDMTKENGEDYDPNKFNIDSISERTHIKPRVHHYSMTIHPIKNMTSPVKKDHKNNHIPIPPPPPVQEEEEEEVLNAIKIDGPFNILSKDDITIFRKQLPKRYQNSDWICLFRTKIHGFSLSTLFNRISGKSPLLLFIKTTDGERIGVFISSGLTISDKYYGSGETYVFRFQPQIECFHWDYHKISCNRYFILSSLDSLSFGASSKDGVGSALYIDKRLNNGYSQNCDTFCSPQLTSKEAFLIEDLEIWHIGISPEFI